MTTDKQPQGSPGRRMSSHVERWVYGRHQVSPFDVIRRREVAGNSSYPRASLLRVLGIKELIPPSQKMPLSELESSLKDVASKRPKGFTFYIGSLVVMEYGKDDFTIEAKPTSATGGAIVAERRDVFDKLGIEPKKDSLLPPFIPLIKSTDGTEIYQNYSLLNRRLKSGDLSGIEYGPLALENHVPRRANHR